VTMWGHDDLGVGNHFSPRADLLHELQANPSLPQSSL
jgi:hypothetical protein